MKINLPFLIITLSLTAIGSWGVWIIVEPNLSHFTQNTNQLDASPQSQTVTDKPKVNELVNLSKAPNDSSTKKDLQKVKNWLEQNNTSKAIGFINDSYDELTSEQLSLFKRAFFNQALKHSDQGELKKAQRLLSKTSELFQEVEIFDLLTNVSVDLQDWKTALNALLKSTLIESRPDVLIDKLSTLANIASHRKSEFAASSDLESVRKLYQSLYDAHPSYASFQLELAFSYLSLNDFNNAKPLFSAVQYDLDVGVQAQEQLAILNDLDRQERQAAINAREELQAKRQQNAAGRNDISISLIRAGNSFLVDSSIEGKQARLLLDTGASITAFSPELISRLRLTPTGDSIRLSTANGITESQLYLAKKIQLGRIVVKDLVVAEINLGESGRFEGLLGTDLLNKAGTNYSYLIDNENNQLIFRRKRR